MDSLIVVLVVVGVVMVLAGVARMRSRRKHTWDDIDHSVLFSKHGSQRTRNDVSEDEEFVGKARPAGSARNEHTAADASMDEDLGPRIHLEELPEVEPPAIVVTEKPRTERKQGRERKIEESVVRSSGVEIKVQKRERPSAPAAPVRAVVEESDVSTVERPQPAAKRSGLLDKLGINISREEEAAEVPTLDVKVQGYKEGAPPWVLVLNITAPDGTHFNGGPLKKAVNDVGLEFGELDMFHYRVDGEIQFSLVNMVKPGTFRMDDIEQMKTPGISLFIQVSELQANAADVYQTMLDTARTLARKLGGEVRDESRSALTQSAIKRNQEKIAEYNMKWLNRR